MDLSDTITLQIRGLQMLYTPAHEVLQNWGAWSRDRRGIFPTLAPPGLWEQAIPSKFGDFADEHEAGSHQVEQAEVKAERPDAEPYDEKAGYELDSRIHGPGGLAPYLREVLRIAYVSREVPESQFPRQAGCSGETFCERLEAGLIFASRYLTA